MLLSRPTIEVALYARAPRLDTAGTIGLINQLVAATPADATENVRRALRRLKKKLIALHDAWTARQRATRPALLRPVDAIDDNAWGAFYDRLVAYTRLPAESFPASARAAQIVATLFPEGLTFLALEYTAQWAQCEMRIRRMHDEGMEAEVTQLVGADFMVHLHDAHAMYGQALGIGRRPEPEAESPDLAAAWREAGEAIVSYAIQVIAMYDPETDADGSVYRAVRAALRPIDVIREKLSREGAPADATPPEGEPAGEPVPVQVAATTALAKT